jgi:hypothetical protein
MYATVGTALGTVLSWVVPVAFNVDLPLEVAGALSVLIISTCTFVAGWLAPPTQRGKHSA